MSQQGPGGYGGGGPHGPPGGYGGQPPGGGYPPGGGGYPPGGGAPPGGYGPPGYPPPGGAPPGYGPAQPGYGGYPGAPPGAGSAGASAKKSKALLWVGMGCGGFLLLGVAGAIAGYLYIQRQASDTESAIAAAASAAAAGNPIGAAPSTLTPSCAKSVACCKAANAKVGGANADLGEQACNELGRLPESVCASQYEARKRTATVLGVTCP